MVDLQFISRYKKKIKLKNMEDKKFKVIIVEDVEANWKERKKSSAMKYQRSYRYGYDRKQILDIDRSWSSWFGLAGFRIGGSTTIGVDICRNIF